MSTPIVVSLYRMSTKPVLFICFPNHKTVLPALFPGLEDAAKEQFHVIFPTDLDDDPQLSNQIVGAIIGVFPEILKIFLAYFPTLTSLRTVISLGVGLDALSPLWDDFWARGIRFARPVGLHTKACADYAWTLLLASAKNLLAGISIIIIVPGIVSTAIMRENASIF